MDAVFEPTPLPPEPLCVRLLQMDVVDGEPDAPFFRPMGEVRHLTAGHRRGALDAAGWRAAASICFDLRFPGMYRLDALDGAVLYVVVAAWPAVRRQVFEALCRARAIEDQVFLAFCNRSGTSREGQRFGGGSMVVGPDGEVLGQLGSRAGELVVELDPAALEGARSPATLGLRHPAVDGL